MLTAGGTTVCTQMRVKRTISFLTMVLYAIKYDSAFIQHLFRLRRPAALVEKANE